MTLPSLSLGMLLACSSLVCFMPGSVQADTSGDFVYEDLGKSIMITGYTGNGGAIVIPEYISDKPVRAIGDEAFRNKVTTSSTLQLPDSLVSIGDSAFAGCSGFTGPLDLPDSLSGIGSSAFASCTGFSGPLEIPDLVTSMGDGAFENCHGFTGSLIIDGGLERIPDRGFLGCSGLDGFVAIRIGVKEIGEAAFYGCNKIRLVELPGGLTTIGKQAFAFCTQVDSYLEIPKSVTSIGDEAFRGLRDLGIIQGEVTFWGNAPVMGTDVFTEAPGLHFVFRQGASGFTTPTWLGYPCRSIPNVQPRLDPIGQKTIMPGESIEIMVHATDADDAELVYSAAGAN